MGLSLAYDLFGKGTHAKLSKMPPVEGFGFLGVKTPIWNRHQKTQLGDNYMSAYVIVDIEILDPVGYEKYKELAQAAVKQYGGRYIARGGPNETLEGEWKANRLVILEFENVSQAKAWLNSPEYAPARALRLKYARSNMVVVQGI
jgi:uncharacterized protein (DUF1330 family)